MHLLAPDWETRDDNSGGGDDPLAEATRAVDELRSANETFRTEQAAAAERHATEVRGLTERLARMETRLNRPGNDNANPAEPSIEVRAFGTFLRRGREAMGAEEVRALRVSDNTAGGFLVPDQFEAELLRDLVLVSPVRQAARVSATSAGSIVLPKRTGRLTAKWVGELEERQGTEPTYGQIEIPVHEIACFSDVSNQLLEDAAIDVEAELRFDFGEEFGRIEGEAFVRGDGIKKPFGLLNSKLETVPSGSATMLTPDSLISTMYALPAYYRSRGTWMMSGKTIGALRLFKDANGQYIWQDGLKDGEPATLLGRPVVEAVDMPDLVAGSTPVLFGDIGSAYRIADRVGMSILRDPFTQATKGMTRFHARRRVGAGVVRPEALRTITVRV